MVFLIKTAILEEDAAASSLQGFYMTIMGSLSAAIVAEWGTAFGIVPADQTALLFPEVKLLLTDEKEEILMVVVTDHAVQAEVEEESQSEC